MSRPIEPVATSIAHRAGAHRGAVGDLPPVIHVPAIVSEDRCDLRMHELIDGDTALFVYSALDRLESAVGSDHEWIVLTLSDLVTARGDVWFDTLKSDRCHPRPPHLTSTGGCVRASPWRGWLA